ncbi:trypsin-7-like [Amyelois transitella]|uniref:trypsin-7-like n=1 Tax=Amyelois transitella TaxID=680683 RepID=UPI0029905943|nr:trypsin-7-like [Amyelois transitella]
MLKLKILVCVIFINNVYSDRTSPDISDYDSLNTEDNEISFEKGNNEETTNLFNLDNNNLEKRDSNETIESGNDDNNVTEKIDTANTITEIASDVVTEIGDSKSIKTKDLLNSNYTFIQNHKNISVTDKSVRNQPQVKLDTTDSNEIKRFDESRRTLFKNCKDRINDDLCRNTLIDYPYAVSIQKLGAHYATGALLDKRWILTVAGEFYTVRESIKLFRVRLGSVNCKRGGLVVPLQEVNIHPLYVPGKAGYDLALLRMGEAVNFTDYIRPIKLSEAKEKVISAKFLATYWPRLIVKGELLPQNASERTKSTSLRVSTQRLIGGQFCRKMMLEMNEHLQEGSLCLKPLVTHHSLCLPDPGAPIAADDGLWGITSGWTSKLCYMVPGPTIFTRISSPLVRSWLETQLLGP